MQRLLASALLLAFVPAMTSIAARPQAKAEAPKLSLKVGDPAPDFSLLSDDWKTVKLRDYHGQKNVFLAVYILAFTGG